MFLDYTTGDLVPCSFSSSQLDSSGSTSFQSVSSITGSCPFKPTWRWLRCKVPTVTTDRWDARKAAAQPSMPFWWSSPWFCFESTAFFCYPKQLFFVQRLATKLIFSCFWASKTRLTCPFWDPRHRNPLPWCCPQWERRLWSPHYHLRQRTTRTFQLALAWPAEGPGSGLKLWAAER